MVDPVDRGTSHGEAQQRPSYPAEPPSHVRCYSPHVNVGPARVAQLEEAAVSNAACSGFESQYGYHVPVVELGIHASLRG